MKIVICFPLKACGGSHRVCRCLHSPHLPTARCLINIKLWPTYGSCREFLPMWRPTNDVTLWHFAKDILHSCAWKNTHHNDRENMSVSLCHWMVSHVDVWFPCWGPGCSPAAAWMLYIVWTVPACCLHGMVVCDMISWMLFQNKCVRLLRYCWMLRVFHESRYAADCVIKVMLHGATLLLSYLTI